MSIVTFYSYKGGVGRSMALANVALELSKKGLNVMMVDWDLEAPGLERYFSNYITDANSYGKGLLPLLREVTKNNFPDYVEYVWHVDVSSYGSVSLMHSGREKDPDNYARNLENFDWKEFFSVNEGGAFLESLRQRWKEDFDIVLIDSRTGLSDSSGICTIFMPDILVPLFTANFQSLYGVRDIVRLAQEARQKLDVDRLPLTILPVPTRFGTRTEFKESQEKR
jgi:cellulose biosynthesis protein BcsQ